MKPLRLDKQTPAETIGAKRAEVISRLWQAIAFLEEVRSDLGVGVRAGQTRDAAAIAITSGTQQLVLAAGILAPKITKPEAAESAEPREGRA